MNISNTLIYFDLHIYRFSYNTIIVNVIKRREGVKCPEGLQLSHVMDPPPHKEVLTLSTHHQVQATQQDDDDTIQGT